MYSSEQLDATFLSVWEAESQVGNSIGSALVHKILRFSLNKNVSKFMTNNIRKHFLH